MGGRAARENLHNKIVTINSTSLTLSMAMRKPLKLILLSRGTETESARRRRPSRILKIKFKKLETIFRKWMKILEAKSKIKEMF